MNTTRFLNELAIRLKDPGHAVFSTDELNAGLAASVREYSIYAPLYKPVGQSQISVDCAAAATTIIAVGGPFFDGDTLNIDVGLPTYEAVTITAPPALADQSTPASLVGVPWTLTVSPLAFAHQAGSVIDNAQMGVAVSANTNVVVLPTDFIVQDFPSFNVAFGLQCALKKPNSFYDSLYWYTNVYSGIGIGESVDYSASQFQQGGFPGIPGNEVVPLSFYGGFYTQIVVRITQGLYPRLIVEPTPPANYRALFYYYAQHIAETIPESDFEACMRFARYTCVMTKWTSIAGRLSAGGDMEIKWDYRGSQESLKALATEVGGDLDYWKSRMRRRPFAVTG